MLYLLYSNLTSDIPFRFGKDSEGKYGYIVTDSEGADSVIPFSIPFLEKGNVLRIYPSGCGITDINTSKSCSISEKRFHVFVIRNNGWTKFTGNYSDCRFYTLHNGVATYLGQASTKTVDDSTEYVIIARDSSTTSSTTTVSVS